MTHQPGSIDDLRVGILGGGFMAAVHSRAARAAGASLQGIVASTPRRSREAANSLGIARAYASSDELIADPSIDIVHVCTPNATHADYVRRVLDAGKHVICEKPLAVDEVEAAELVARAEQCGKVAAVPFVYRYHPMVQELRARIDRGEIGRLITVHGVYLQEWLLEATEHNWRVNGADGGRSRAFADIGSHLVDLIEFTTGEQVAALSAATSIVHPERGAVPVTTEDVAALTVRFTGGAIGTLLVSQTAAGHDNDLRVEIMGTSSAITFRQEEPETLRIGRRGSTTTLTRSAPGLCPATHDLSLVPAGHPMGYQEAFNAFVRDVYAGVTGQLPERVPVFADGLRMNRVTSAVLESAASAAWVDVAEMAVAR